MAKKKKGPGRSGPNLKKTDKHIINQNGVKITYDEARQLRNLTARVNYKAAKMEKEFKGAPIFFGTRQLQENREQLKIMGEEMDIMIRKRSFALNEFTSKRSFNQHMKSLERVLATDYLDYRGKLYKRNLITKLKAEYAEYPDLIKGVIMRIQMMPQNQFQKLIGDNRAFQIKTHYNPKKRMNNIMAMRDSLGMRSPYDDYVYDY